jgi:preprotein translocase subunit YajC
MINLLSASIASPFWATALAQATPEAAPPSGPAALTPFVYMAVMVVIFYFILIRPQAKAKKEQEELIAKVKVGDKVVTSGGILGTIANVKDKTVVVKVADNVKIEVQKTHLATVTKASEEKETSAAS